LLQHQVGGHLEQEIAPEENAGAEAIGLGRKAQIVIHGQGGKGDVHPVQEADDIHQRHERNQPPGSARQYPVGLEAKGLWHHGTKITKNGNGAPTPPWTAPPSAPRRCTSTSQSCSCRWSAATSPS